VFRHLYRSKVLTTPTCTLAVSNVRAECQAGRRDRSRRHRKHVFQYRLRHRYNVVREEAHGARPRPEPMAGFRAGRQPQHCHRPRQPAQRPGSGHPRKEGAHPSLKLHLHGRCPADGSRQRTERLCDGDAWAHIQRHWHRAGSAGVPMLRRGDCAEAYPRLARRVVRAVHQHRRLSPCLSCHPSPKLA